MNKTVLITGASRGIGREIAKLFAANDYNVAINYFKSEEEAEKLYLHLRDEGYSVIKVQGDVSNRIQVDSMMNIIYNRFGDIAVLVNNAGVAQQNYLLIYLRMIGIECLMLILKGYLIAAKLYYQR